MALRYRPATEEEIARMRAQGVPISEHATDVLVPVDPAEVQRMRHEMLTGYPSDDLLLDDLTQTK